MKTLESLTKASQVKNEESQCVYVSDCNAQVWFDGKYFCARKDGVSIIRRKTFIAIWGYLYTR
jgi:hypothetical protein